MKRVDRLVIGELLAPFMFGVAIFTVLVMAATFLYTFTRLLSEGVPATLVAQLFVLVIPGIINKTLSMAMLLGTLLAFGRLSGDSEIVALRASGVNVFRIVAPVAFFGLVVSVVGYWFGDYVVPQSAIRATALQTELSKQADTKGRQATSQWLYDKGNLIGVLNAKDFSLVNRTLTDVNITTFDKQGQPETMFIVDMLKFDTLEKWQAVGKAKVYFFGSGLTVEAKGLWPDTVAKPELTPEDLAAMDMKNLDSFSSTDFIKHIERMKSRPDHTLKQLRNLEFGYWNKFSLPLAGLIFGLVGAPLGIRSHRAGTATGFWLSILIIFAYMLVANSLSIMAQAGAIPSSVASFGPVLAGLIVGGYLIVRKNGT